MREISLQVFVCHSSCIWQQLLFSLVHGREQKMTRVDKGGCIQT